MPPETEPGSLTSVDGGTANPGPAVSVVVASVECARTIEASLESVKASLSEIGTPGAEVILMDASRDGTGDLVRRGFPDVFLEEQAPGTLIPELWARGIERARGSLVALTTGHCVVGRDWIRSLTSALDPAEAVAGVGGPLRLRRTTGVVDWAVYFLRYSAFLPEEGARRPGAQPAGWDTPGPIREIAADNAMYRAEDLQRHQAGFGDGFWEVPFHAELRKEGRGLHWVPEAEVGFGPAWPFRTIAAHRYTHGRRFGRWRVGEGGERPIRVLLPSPLVPLVLAVRTAWRIRGQGGLMVRFVASLPWYLVLAGAWALGEARGAWER